MRIALLTHAIAKTPLYVDLDLVGIWYHSDAAKATHVVLVGGGMAPVVESPEEVSKLKEGVAMVAAPTKSKVTRR